MNNSGFPDRLAAYLVLGVVATIPLIFGAVHPLVLGCYVFVMLVGLGGWLLLRPPEFASSSLNFWVIVPLVIIVYIIFQSIPLPFELVEFISPHRAERVRMVNELAGTDQTWISISDNGIAGLYRSFFLLGLMLYYFSLRRLFTIKPKMFSTVVICLIAVGSFEALYGLLQFVKPQLGILWLKVTAGRAAYGTIIYKNQYASLMNMIWPLAIAGGTTYFFFKSSTIRKRSRFKEIADTFSATKIQAPVLLFGAGMMMLAVLFSLSRGGILAMLLVGFCLIVVLPYSRKGKLYFLLAFVLVVAGYSMLLGLDTIFTRFANIGSSGSTRLNTYLSSLPILFDHKLTGIGLGSYNLLSPVYLKGFPVGVHFDRVHNEYLEIMLELGLPAALLLFCWLGGGMVTLFQGLRTAMVRKDTELRKIVFGTAAYCSMLGFLVHGSIDFGWRLPVNVVYAVTLLALCKESIHSWEASTISAEG